MIQIKNISGEVKELHIKEFQIDEIYDIPNIERNSWASNEDVIKAITNASFQVYLENTAIINITKQLDYLNGKKAVLVQPTSPLNEYTLKPFGLTFAKINSSTQISDITLSNKSENTYNFSCTQVPAFYDCITSSDNTIRDGVYDVDGGSLTTFYGAAPNGDYKLIKPINIDCQVPVGQGFDTFYLWGCYGSIYEYGEADTIRLQIIDKDGVGVELGWYTQEQFDYMGEFLVLEYDECWVNHVSGIKKLMTPDGAPGEIASGLYLRVKYYPKDVTKTDIRFYLDYILTVKE
jgi:hypothetical protein